MEVLGLAGILLVVALFLKSLRNLLVSLVVLEILGLFVILALSLILQTAILYSALLIVFVIFVVEAVVGLVGFVLLVSFRGADYIGLSAQTVS